MPFPRLVRNEDPATLSDRSDDELMALSRAGLRSAFATLVERHAVRLVNACARFVNDAQLGTELAQDTWVLIWQNREKYRAQGTFLAWALTIARNHAKNHLRQRGRALPLEERLVAELEGLAPGGLDALLLEERRARVRRALGQLPVPLREALLLRFAEELRYDEMTSVLGAQESTLRSRVHHGLRTLKRKLKEES